MLAALGDKAQRQPEWCKMGMENNKDQFVRATMRHFAFYRSTMPESVGQGVPFPDDWFDLPPDVLADYGAVFFLTALTRYHRRRSLEEVFVTMEPALRLGQYKIFQSGGYPRAFVTWAGLAPDVEKKFSVDHIGLEPHEWNSGTSTWLVDLIAPFGQIDQIVALLGKNHQTNRVRTLHHNADGSRYRVVEWARARVEDPYCVRSFGHGQFRDILKQEAAVQNG